MAKSAFFEQTPKKQPPTLRKGRVSETELEGRFAQQISKTSPCYHRVSVFSPLFPYTYCLEVRPRPHPKEFRYAHTQKNGKSAQKQYYRVLDAHRGIKSPARKSKFLPLRTSPFPGCLAQFISPAIEEEQEHTLFNDLRRKFTRRTKIKFY